VVLEVEGNPLHPLQHSGDRHPHEQFKGGAGAGAQARGVLGADDALVMGLARDPVEEAVRPAVAAGPGTETGVGGRTGVGEGTKEGERGDRVQEIGVREGRKE